MPLLSLSKSRVSLVLFLLVPAQPGIEALTTSCERRFQTTGKTRRTRPFTTTSLQSSPFSGTGWDNDDFLSSLSQPQEEPPSWGPPQTSTTTPPVQDSPPHFSNAFDPRQQQQQVMYPPPPPPQQQNFQYPPQQYQQQYSVPPPPQYQQQQPMKDSPNDDSGNDDLPSGDIKGAEPLTENMKARIKATNELPEEEASQGGERFRKMMQRATVQQATFSQQQQQQQQQQPTFSYPPLQLPPNAMNLPIEEQARLFREIMARQQMQQMNRPFPVPQGQSQMQPPPVQPMQPVTVDPYQQQYSQWMQGQPQQSMYPHQQYWQPPQYYPSTVQTQELHRQYATPQPTPAVYHPQTSPRSNYLEPSVGFDGRKIGRNRDADTIANTADAYFARLKRDSTTRNFARYAGDDKKANAVFHDPSIQEIHAPELNPYLEEQRKKERDMLETVPEEMLLFHDFHEESVTGDRIFSGISYKDKVAQLKARSRGNNNDNNNQ